MEVKNIREVKMEVKVEVKMDNTFVCNKAFVLFDVSPPDFLNTFTPLLTPY